MEFIVGKIRLDFNYCKTKWQSTVKEESAGWDGGSDYQMKITEKIFENKGSPAYTYQDSRYLLKFN